MGEVAQLARAHVNHTERGQRFESALLPTFSDRKSEPVAVKRSRLFYENKIKEVMVKKLSDGTLVTSRSYYYLLDWNDLTGWKYMKGTFNKERLSELTRSEYKKLFEVATKSDLTQFDS